MYELALLLHNMIQNDRLIHDGGIIRINETIVFEIYNLRNIRILVSSHEILFRGMMHQFIVCDRCRSFVFL